LVRLRGAEETSSNHDSHGQGNLGNTSCRSEFTRYRLGQPPNLFFFKLLRQLNRVPKSFGSVQSLSFVSLVWPHRRTHKHNPSRVTIFHDNCGFFLLHISAQRTTLRAGIHDRIRGIVCPLHPSWVHGWTFSRPKRRRERTRSAVSSP